MARANGDMEVVPVVAGGRFLWAIMSADRSQMTANVTMTAMNVEVYSIQSQDSPVIAFCHVLRTHHER